MDHRDKLLKLVQEKGPLLPSQINKELNTNVLFASAMLSEMVDTKKLKLTSLKIGGSPLYYHPGQEEKLQEYSNKLDEKDQKTFKIIKQSKVLRDRDQEPLTRVSLREIKDFAIPLQVTVNDKKELFWKFYTVTDDDAEKKIREYLEKHNYLEPKKEEHKEEQKEIKTEEPRSRSKERHREAQTTIAELAKKPEEKEEIEETHLAQLQEKADIKTVSDAELNYSYSFSYSNTEKKEEPVKEQEPPEDDEFYTKVTRFFSDSNITVDEFTTVRKGTEYDFIIRIPTAVGELRHFCKARSKKKLNDGDISSAFVAGQMKGLPTVMLITGEMTTRAQEMTEKELKGFTVKNIDQQ